MWLRGYVKMEQLLQEIANLEVQLDLFQRQRDSADNESSVVAFEAEIANVVTKIEAKKAQIEQLKQKESEIVATVTSGESSFGISAGGYYADFRALAGDEDKYQMLSITTQLYLAQIESEQERNIKALEDSYEAEKSANNDRINALEDELDQSRQDLSDVRGKLEIASNTITDLEIERDSAVKEADKLRKQIEELRQQITVKPKVVTNIDGAATLSDIAARLEAKKKPVYDVTEEFRSQKGMYTLFKLAESGEPGECLSLYFNAHYRKIKDSEVSQFRAQEEIHTALLESASTAEEVEVPKLQFQIPDAEVPEHVLHGESATEDNRTHEPIEEIVARLTKRVERLEVQAGIGV